MAAARRWRRRLWPALLCLALLLCAQPLPSCQASRPLDRRFAEYKRCTDPECSMLMCRGKAVKDFKGPDCRFVDFKEGESVYVYYKLSGRTNDLWAGSVGSNFGYFPKDLLEINHIYTHDELEVPTDETDFICFEDGKDDFDNYNVDELLKLSEDTVGSEMKDDLETDKEEETEKADPTESIYPESDGLEMDSEESSEDPVEMSEQDNLIFEKNKNVEGSLDSRSENHAVNSDTDNPQGDQSAHQPSEDMLQEMLKVPELESAKNATVSQGESKQSDYGSKNDSAYKHLHQETSEDLKTTFGSTADAFVSDDETTSLVTSLDGDAEQDLDIDSYDVENLEDLHKESDEIPLLSFTKEDIKSSEDPETENTLSVDIFESETSDPDDGTREASTKLINQKKDDSGLLTHIGDKIFAIVSGGERTTAEDKDDLEEEEEEEEEDKEVAVISKKENGDVLAHLETSSENDPLTSEHDLITKNVHNVDIIDPKEEKTQEKELTKSGVEPTTEKLQSMHTFGAFSNYGDVLQSKASIETEEETLKPPLGDIQDDPEGLSFHKIIKDKEREGKKHLEDSLENDTKHKTVWDKQGKTEDEKEKSEIIVSELLEELINESQSDLDDANILESKTEYDTKQDGKDFELKMVLDEKQLNVSAMENVPIEKDIEEAIKESKQEREAQYLEEDEEEEEENDLTSSKEILEKRSGMEKSMRATQHGNFTQQNIVEVEQISTDGDMDGEESPEAELQSLELDAEEDSFLEDPEEELLQDENALSAKMSKEKLASEQGFTSGLESASPQPQMPSDAISRAANPADSSKEANTMLEQAQREASMRDLNKENEGMQIKEDSQLNEMKENKDEEQKHFLVDKKHKNLDHHDKMTPSSLNISELEDKKDDLNETGKHLQEDLSQEGFEDKQFSAEGKPQHSHDPSGPIGVSEHASEATEPEYSESVRQLTIMKEFLDVKCVARLQKYLGEQHLFRIESLFHDMELELMIAQKHDNPEDSEKALDEILETSESNVLDIVNNVLDAREIENKEEVIREMDLFDEEAALLDDIQELMYSLRQKYSPISESTPLASLSQSEMDSGVSITANPKQVEHDIHSIENTAKSTDQKIPGYTEQISQEDAVLQLDQPDGNILTETETLDELEGTNVLDGDKILPPMDTVLGSDDSGRTIERDSIADLIGVKDDTVEESLDSSEADSDTPYSIASWDASVFYVKNTMRSFTEIFVSTLPEEIRPGPDFHGLPWEPIIVTALVGFATLFIFIWRTCLPVKSRAYQVTEKQLAEKIKKLLQDKAEILEKLSDYDQKIKESNESAENVQKQNTDLSDTVSGLKNMVDILKEKNNLLDGRVINLETKLKMETETRMKKQEQITELEKSLEKFQETFSLRSIELSEFQKALSEAKLTEEAVKSELRCVLEENVRLKRSKEQLLQEVEGWSERHTELSEQITLYQKSQKDIEEALAYKENEIEALTNCIMQLKQLDADSELEDKRDEANDLANGELSGAKSEKMKNRIKQMMEVSRVKTTLSIIEEEKNYLQSKLNDEVAARHELEEQIKKLEHDSSSLQTAKSQLENDCNLLHQKMEILNELYQQKEMALQKKLTQEELERQEKEQKLSAADVKAGQAVEEVKIYKQRIQEMEEELQKTEQSYKKQLAAHEKKAHENWLLARSAERTLTESKREASNLRHKLLEVNKKIVTLQSPLIMKPIAGRPDHQVLPPRGPLSRDGSFGPSPVSGGAPSPPLIMELPGRPLSTNPREGSRDAVVCDGPPLPRRHSEVSGRMSAPDLGPPAALINCGPKTSSPSIHDGMVNMGPKGPPPFSRTPMMASPPAGPLPPTVQFGPPPHQAPYGPRTLPLSLVRGGSPLPIPRDYPPGPPLSVPRDYPPGPPFGMRCLPPGSLPPPEQRGYLRGPPPPFWPPPPRDYPPGPQLPPQGIRAYPPPPAKDLPPSGPKDYQGGPSCPPAISQDSAHKPEQKP
ncbi:transport and Golgi organization protein 1 homolog isoform X2 [Tiliqua scincoides]|uniref:transport and Golgi organization protein 1 homolog isoform X2 n=1 Tax=Tiliqua scincoides TaxID=71010 RepID=UPI00346295A5